MSKAAFWLEPRGNLRPTSIVENFAVGIPIEFRVNHLTVEINRFTLRGHQILAFIVQYNMYENHNKDNLSMYSFSTDTYDVFSIKTFHFQVNRCCELVYAN